MTLSRAMTTWVAATFVIGLAAGCRQRPSPEGAALANVVREAQTAELNLDVDHVQTELAKYYVGTLLARKVAVHRDALRAMAEAGAGGCVGGVRTRTLKDVQISGTAKVRSEVTVWFKTAQIWYQSVTGWPEATNVIDLDLHLVKDSGT